MLFQKGKTDAARFEMIPLERIQMTEWNVITITGKNAGIY